MKISVLIALMHIGVPAHTHTPAYLLGFPNKHHIFSKIKENSKLET